MKQILKNIPKNEVLNLPDLVEIHPGQIISKTLAQNDKVSITLFAFDEARKLARTTQQETLWQPYWTERDALASVAKST